MSTLHLRVGGMHCSLCTQSIERALTKLDGVSDTQVSLAHQEVLVNYDPGRVRVDAVTRTLQHLGFAVREPDKVDVFAEEEKELALAKRVAKVAGTLVTVAAILMLVRYIVGSSLGFNVAQGVLALVSAFWPVSFVFRNAFQSLRRGILNQDVLAASAASAGLVGGVLGLIWTVFPAGGFFGATTFVLAFHCVGGFASILVHVRASQSVQQLLSLQPDEATRIHADGHEEVVRVEVLDLGNQVRVRPGQRIPVDGKIIQGSSAIDQQLVTGEPLPIERQPGDEVIGGSLNLYGSLVLEVTRVGEDSFLRRVTNQVAEARVMKPGILRLVDRILNIYVPAVFTMALVGGLIWAVGGWLFAGQPIWLRTGFAVLGALVMGYPCALGMATPLAIIRASGEAAERGILMRSGEAFQVFRMVDTIVFDKTGTLTEGKPEVTSVWAVGNGKEDVLHIAAGAEWSSEHPIAKAIVAAAQKQDVKVTPAEQFTALSGRGIEAEMDGSQVVIGTERLMNERNVSGLSSAKAWVAEQQKTRRTVVFVAAEDRIIGAISIADQVKQDAKEVVEALRKRGIQAVMATGDHELAANAVAKELGISDVRAGLLPEDKLSLVRQLQKKGHRVAFVGDGINDAPSLMQANVGIALGSGTDIAIESADVVIPGERLVSVLQAQTLARTSYAMTVRNVFLALTLNGVGILVSLTGLLQPIWAMLAMALSLSTVLSHSLFSKLVTDDRKHQVA